MSRSSAASSGRADRYPTTRYAVYVVFLFFIAAILSYTDRLILNILVDPIRHDLKVSDTQVSVLQGAAFAVLYAFVSLPLGLSADRFNRRNLVLLGMVVWSAATAACGLARDFPSLFAARVCVGLGEAALAPAVMSMIPDYFPPERRGAAIGVFLTGMTMGGGTAIIAGGALLQAFDTGALALPAVIGRLAPWREVLLTLSIPGFILAPVLLTVREPARHETLSPGGQGKGAANLSVTLHYFWRNRGTFGFLVTAFALNTLVGYGTDSWLPSTLMRRFAVSPGVAGASIGLTSLICGGAGTLAGGVLADRMGAGGRLDGAPRFALIASVCALPLLVFPLLSPLPAVMAGYGAYGFILSMAGVAGITATQNAVPGEMRGITVALQAFMYTLVGLGLGPTLVALATDHLYRASSAVGLSIVTVSAPASVIAAALLWRALGHYRATRARVIGAVP